MVVEGVGVSLPGRVNPDGRLVFAPNLRWPEVDLRGLFEARVGLPVVLENAANACALAELWFGRHPEDVKHLVAVTVSEGIGVGLLLNGQLVHGAGAMAGEFGHVTIDEAGPPCSCGKRGCWERYASNTAAIRYYAESGGHATPPPDLRFEDLLRHAEQGDDCAREALRRMAESLGMGLAVLATGLAPDVIVIVGDITAVWDQVGPVIEAIVRTRSLARSPTRLIATDRNERPRLRGAVTLVVQQHFGAPDVA
jgi:predicted NBD/HSP70 family sugar kinase